jgi:hypothetical protein
MCRHTTPTHGWSYGSHSECGRTNSRYGTVPISVAQAWDEAERAGTLGLQMRRPNILWNWVWNRESGQ